MNRETPRKFSTTPGTRDVLPPESTRLLDVQAEIRDRFKLFGFSEVVTPALEYSEVIEEQGLRDAAYKLFDRDNQMLLLRPEMTTPIARLVAQRLAGSPGVRLGALVGCLGSRIVRGGGVGHARQPTPRRRGRC